MDIKYDRQIRLFGKDVQDKLGKLKISIISKYTEFISGEILKNIVLLGVNEIYADTNTLISFSKLVPNRIEDINPKVKLLKDFSDNSDMIFFISKCNDDHFKNKNNIIYVCKDHYGYKSSWGACKGQDIINDKIKECLLGGIIVQEFIKKLQNQKYQKEFSLNDLL